MICFFSSNRNEERKKKQYEKSIKIKLTIDWNSYSFSFTSHGLIVQHWKIIYFFFLLHSNPHWNSVFFIALSQYYYNYAIDVSNSELWLSQNFGMHRKIPKDNNTLYSKIAVPQSIDHLLSVIICVFFSVDICVGKVMCTVHIPR